MNQSESLWGRSHVISAGFAMALAGILAFFIASSPALAADSSAANSGPPSSWVKPHFFDQSYAAAPADSGSDQRYLLIEQQINAVQNETFSHFARQILTLNGVQNGSTLTIPFNPAYEDLTLHWVRIWRGTQHLERLDTNNVKIVQQEQNLDEYILDGRKSAVLVLDDVRVGDIIDYSYSLKGTNPVLGDHFSADIPVQRDESAGRIFTRVLWPKDKRLYTLPHGCSYQPVAMANTNALEYVWDLRQVPGLEPEDLLPAWCDPEPWIQLSDFKSWAEVDQWALALFRVNSPLSSQVTRKIAEWRQLPDPESQTLAALRFVQDDVRYFGIEMGDSAEKPSDPSLVYSRRFGDCKDKSLLFVTILRMLGIQAYPVLVNSTMGRAIAGWQPSAGAFDHCIAVAVIGRQNYWLDPTINYQRGPLAAHYLPAYGYGLVITPTTTALTAIPQINGMPTTSTTEYFTLQGVQTPATLTVVTTTDGRDADALRELFATTKRNEIEKNYTHYYSELYPGVHMSSPITISDDEQQNRIQTTEYYSIDNAWNRSDKDKKYRCEFYPYAVASFFKSPVDTNRKFPLGVSYPEHHILRTEVTLPQAWPSDSDQKTINDSAFTFSKDCRCAGNKLVMQYDYQSQADSVAPDAMSAYLDNLNKSSQSLGYTVIWQ